MQYRVVWKPKGTKQANKGEPISHDDAMAWADWANKKYPDLHHWVEAVPEEKPTTAGALGHKKIDRKRCE
jgi:hypothetical protein